MSAYDYREWLDSTPAGAFRRAQGISESVDHDQAERVVAETRSFWRTQYGRELSDREIAVARQAAEARSLVTTGSAPSTSWHLAETLGWGVQVKPREQLEIEPIGPRHE